MKITKKIKMLFTLFSTTTVALISGVANAQSFPSKPIKLVVPYAVGGAMDAAGRIVAT